MAAETIVTSGVRASRREWTGLAVLALPTLLLSLDMSVLYLALPQLSADLGASATQQLWIMDSYGFLIAGLAPFRQVTAAFFVDSVAEHAAELRRLGAGILQEPRQGPFGMFMIVRHPDGLVVEYADRTV